MASASDDFNRADTTGPTIGTGWIGTAQGMAGNGFQIVSNVIQPTTLASDKLAFYSGINPSANHFSQAAITVNGAVSTTGIGVSVRAKDDGSHYRVVANDGDTLHISKFVRAGASLNFTSLAFRMPTGNPPWVDGDVLRFEAQGTTLRVYVNGVQVGADITDSSLSEGYPGLSYSSTSTSASLDNWQGGTLPVVGDDHPIQISGRGAC